MAEGESARVGARVRGGGEVGAGEGLGEIDGLGEGEELGEGEGLGDGEGLGETDGLGDEKGSAKVAMSPPEKSTGSLSARGWRVRPHEPRGDEDCYDGDRREDPPRVAHCGGA